MPKVTVLMPVYNAGKFLREAIDSILNQTFKDFEFLIINDGSTDKTAQILQSYHDPRIKIVDNKVNIGLTRSLNKGLKIAKGKYIARMDADDISLPDRLEKQLPILEEDENIGLISSRITLIDENNNEMGDWHTDRKNNSPEEIFYTLFFENCLAHSSVFYIKDIVLKIGGYNESFEKAQDYQLWARLAKSVKIVKIRKMEVKIRIHAKNTNLQIIKLQDFYAEKTFLTNVKNLLSEKINSDLLLSVKYNNSAAKVSKNNLFDVLNTFNKINRQLINTAPSFLDKKKLRRCGQKKRYKILKKSFVRKLTLNGLLSPEKIGRVLNWL